MDARPLTYDDALHVARNMRERDKAEIYATRWNDSAEDVATDCVYGGPFAWSFWHGGEPVAVVGAMPIHPGVWTVYMFASDKFNAVSTSLTKFIRRVIIPALVENGAHRAECKSLATYDEAHRWLEMLGARQEGPPLREYGRNREDFVVYVWHSPEKGG